MKQGMLWMLMMGVVLSGCSRSHLLERYPAELPFAPENNPGKGGRVVYEIGGKDGVEGRAEAYKQMAEVCGGRYRIVREYDGAASYKIGAAGYGVGVPLMFSAGYLVGSATPLVPRVVEFECSSKPKQGERPAPENPS